MSAGKILIGYVIATATGIALGMLLAPDKGSATRKKIAKQGSRYMDAIESTAQDAAATFEETVDNVKQSAGSLSDKVMGAVDSFTGHEPEKHTRRG